MKYPLIWSDGVLVTLFAFLAAFFSTLYGTVEIFDLSVNFQTAQRMVHGQRLYTDFFIPNGPLAALLLIPFARFFSVGWALLLSSALLNSLATLTLFFLLSQAGVSRRRIIWGSVLTAIWYLPPMGGFYHDHLSFLFVLLALTRPLSLFWPTLWLTLAFHSKQTIGTTAMVVYFLCEIYHSNSRKKMAARFIGGILLWNITVFSVWSVLFDWHGYRLATFVWPASYFGEFPQNLVFVGKRFLESVLIPFGINPIRMLEEMGVGRLIFFPVVFATYFCLIDVWKHHFEKSARTRLELSLLFSTLLCGSLLGRSFAHLFFGLGGALAVTQHPVPKNARATLLCVLCLSGILFVIHGRGIHQPQSRAFDNSALWPLSAENSPRADALALFIHEIKTGGGDYYLTDNISSLIPLALGIPPVNFCLDYHDGTGVPTEKMERLHWQYQRVLEISEKRVRYLVLSRLGAANYRLIREYLKSNFNHKIGSDSYSLFERRPDPSPAKISRN